MVLSAARIRTWAWLLIYGGLAAIGLGEAVRRRDEALGWPLLIAGALAVVAGVTLIWVRSRIDEPNEKL